MHIYDFLLWLVFVSEVVCAVLEVLAEAGETVEHRAWQRVLHMSG
jgi:hypothetical protein